jgi:negative regulator of flagellin synthesis FlgM
MVDTTKPLDGTPPRKDVARAAVRKPAAEPAEGREAQAPAQNGEPASVADSVTNARHVLGTAGAEVARVDARTIAELREAIRNGTFRVDPEALADRMLDDALGGLAE